MTRPGRWLTPWHPRPAESPVLLCVPPAGGGCGRYARWQKSMGPGTSVVGVALPGRERRWAEPAASTLAEVVDAVTAELCELVPPGTPVVVFGESFGGLIGYEIARRIGAMPGRRPAALVVAACRPPSMWVGAGHGLAADDDTLLSLLDLTVLDGEVDDDSLEVMLTVLRGDARLSATYADPRGAPVPGPVHAWGGAQDALVTSEHLDGWYAYAPGHGFSRRQFPGGHHFCSQSPDDVGRAMHELMAALTMPSHVPIERS